MFKRMIYKSLTKTDQRKQVQDFCHSAMCWGGIGSTVSRHDRVRTFKIRYQNTQLYFYDRGLRYAKVCIDNDLVIRVPSFYFREFEVRRKELKDNKDAKSWNKLIDRLNQ